MQTPFQRSISASRAGVKAYSFGGGGTSLFEKSSLRFEEVGGLNDLVSPTFALCTVSSTGATEIIPSIASGLVSLSNFQRGFEPVVLPALLGHVSRNDTLTPHVETVGVVKRNGINSLFTNVSPVHRNCNYEFQPKFLASYGAGGGQREVNFFGTPSQYWLQRIRIWKLKL